MLSLSVEDREGLGAALQEAHEAAVAGEVPVGAVIRRGNQLVARGQNEMIRRHDPTAHAEVLAIRSALERTGGARLTDATLYVTLEPCAQCAGAIVLARVGRVVFGAWDPKAGMSGSIHDILRHPKLNHGVEVLGGVMAEECGAMLQAFFRERRGPE